MKAKLYKFSVVYAVKNEDTFDFGDMLQEAVSGDILVEEVHSLSDLPPGWDDWCIPFGESDEAPIRTILSDDDCNGKVVEIDGKKYRLQEVKE
jgi:hypothetical protein